MPGGWGTGKAKKDPLDDISAGGLAGRISEIGGTLFQNQEGYGGNEEETQGLLGYAEKGIRTAAEKAGNLSGLGNNMSAAVQIATIGKQRWTLFFILLAIGCILMALSFTMLPLIVLMPHKFAFVFTTGSLCFMASFSVLKGPGALWAHLTAPGRLAISAGYVGSMAGTLWASMWYRSTLLTLGFSGLQIVELLWFFASYIPGGPMVMAYLSDAVKSCCGKLCCGCCCGGGSTKLPL